MLGRNYGFANTTACPQQVVVAVRSHKTTAEQPVRRVALLGGGFDRTNTTACPPQE